MLRRSFAVMLLPLVVLSALESAVGQGAHRTIMSLDSSAPPLSAITDVVMGRFTEDRDLDVAMIRNGMVELRADFERFDTTLESTIAAQHLAVWPKSDGDLDQLLVVNSGGLHAVRYRAGAWVSTLLAPRWSDATAIHCVDLDLNGDHDFVVVTDSGMKVEYTLQPGATIGPIGEVPLTEPAVDAVPFDLDGVGFREIAVLYASGDLRIHSAGGASWGFFGNGPGGSIARIPVPGQTSEWISWIRPVAGDSEQVSIGNDLVEHGGVLLGDSDPIGAVVTDIDLDGNRDLVVTSRTTNDVRTWFNVSAGGSAPPAFSPSSVSTLISTFGSASSAQNQTLAAIGDADGDRDHDIVHTLPGLDEMILWQNNEVSHRDLMPRTDFLFHDIIFDPDQTPTGDSQIRVDLRNGLTIPTDATHVEINVRFRPDVVDNTPAYGTERFLLPVVTASRSVWGVSYSPYSMPLIQPTPIGPPPACPYSDGTSYIDGTAFNDDSTYSATFNLVDGENLHGTIYIDQRYVRLVDEGTPNERVGQIWPSYIQAVTRDCGSLPLAYSQAQANKPLAAIIESVAKLLGTIFPEDSTDVTTVVENKPITNLPPNDEPKDNENPKKG